MSEAFRRVALAVQAALNRYDPASRGADAALADGAFAPVFIIGPPRSGTTLLYQALCRTAEVCFISNLMAVAPMFMLRLARLKLRRTPPPEAPFGRGDFGFLPGLFSPSEAGKVIDRWFDPAHLAARRDPTRRMAAALGARTGRPLLIKAIPLGLRLDRVLKVFPEARFVFITRDPVYVAQSLFAGQGNPDLAADRWEGVQPPGFEDQAARGPEYQTAWQIAEILRRIEAGLATVDPGRVTRIRYEELCADPAGTVAGIGAALSLQTAPEGLPASFSISRKRSIPDESWEKIAAACAELGLAAG